MKTVTLCVNDGVQLESTIGDEALSDVLQQKLDEAIKAGCTHYVADISNDVEEVALRYMLTKKVACVMITPPEESIGACKEKNIELKLRIIRASESGQPHAVYPYDATPDELHILDLVVYITADACILSEHANAHAATSKFFSLLGYQ